VLNAETLRDFLLARRHATEETPFGPDHLVYKIAGRKLFAILSPEEVPVRVNLKCDPERALDLRDRHPAIQPGYHMNKKHWNTVLLDGSLPAPLIRDLVEHSYELVFGSLPKKVQRELGLEN
jgi:predicted DNA-binding protein (MmcQ/YjbR family)